MSKRIWEWVAPMAGVARYWSPVDPMIEQQPAPQRRAGSPHPTVPPLPDRNVSWLARAILSVIILVNLVAGGTIWLIKAQPISQSAGDDLSAHLAHIQTLLAQPDLLDPDQLERLDSELAAAEQDLQRLQATVPVIGQLGIGPSGDMARAISLGAHMVLAGQDLVAAARVLQPSLLGFTDGILEGSSTGLQVGHSRLTVAEIELAQRDIAAAKQAWQQALSDWGAFASGMPQLPSAELRLLVTAMGTMSHTFTVALAATSAMLDWSATLFGLESPTKVLLVEENPDVLRPTGGAITHYAILTLDQGMLLPNIKLQSISALDCPQRDCPASALPPPNTWIPVSKAPVQVGDGNLDPDLATSGWSIYNHFVQEGGPQVAGVIVATQDVFADILGAVGPVTIEGLPGEFTATNVVQRMRAVRADQAQLSQLGAAQGGTPTLDIDALMFDAILTRLKALTAQQHAALGHALLQALVAKDLQLFTSNARVEASFQDLNIAGQPLVPSGDSLEIVDTNVTGEPINPFIKETAIDSVVLDAYGGATHELSLTYHNGATAVGSPRASYTDVVRVVVPNATVNEQISGPCVPLQTTQAYHGVLACELSVAPDATVRINFSWRIPQVAGPSATDPLSYSLLVQRQPGANIDIDVAIQAPPGRSITAGSEPGQIADRQLKFSAAPLLRDTTVHVLFRDS